MPLDITYYKDQVLNKLGEYSDRASAAFKDLGNIQVNLTLFSNAESMCNRYRHTFIGPITKDKFKEKHEYEETRQYTPSRLPTWWDDDCTCDDCMPRRGRPISRIPLIHGEGSPLQQNVNQQNINIVPGFNMHRTRSTSSHSPDYWDDLPSCPHVIPRHADGHCCIHGRGWQCPLCHPRRLPHQRPMLGGYMPVPHEDGRVDLVDVPKFVRSAMDFADEVQRKRKEDEEHKMRKMYDTADMIQKMFKPDHYSPGWNSGWGHRNEYGSQRSSAQIRAELEKARADKKQYLLKRTVKSKCAGQDQLVMCSGALQGGDGQTNGRLCVGGGRDCQSSGRVMEIIDDDGKAACLCESR